MLSKDQRNWLYTSEVAERLKVGPKTISRWAQQGKLPFVRTLGGHRRYPEAEILELEQELAKVET